MAIEFIKDQTENPFKFRYKYSPEFTDAELEVNYEIKWEVDPIIEDDKEFIAFCFDLFYSFCGI